MGALYSTPEVVEVGGISIPISETEDVRPHPLKAFQITVIVAEAIVSLIGIFCILMVNDDRYSAAAGGWFMFVATTAVFKNVAALGLHRDSSSLIRRIIILAEFVFNVIWTVFYLMAATAVASRAAYDDAYAAAAFFGFVCMILFAIDTGNMFNIMFNYRTVSRISGNV